MSRSVDERFDEAVTDLARRIGELGSGEDAGVYRMSWWSEHMLGWAMSHPSFKTQLFRFVDVFPATTDDEDVLRHLREYFDHADAPRFVDLGMGLADHVPGGQHLSASVARRNITRMAEQFIAGATPRQAVEGLGRLWRLGSAATVDLLGEKTVTSDEADRYAKRVDELLGAMLRAAREWPADEHLDRDDLGPLPRANVSLKPTALAPLYAPLTADEGIAQAKARLHPILAKAAVEGAFIYLDMEHADVKDLTLRLFMELLDDPALSQLNAGIVVQAYLKDSADDLARVIAWSSARRTPVTVRLVKGAYWDAETVEATAEGWPSPVFARKVETDANYERCVRMLHDHHGDVRAAFGSHNLRSLAYAVSYARHKGIPDSGYELQMLYGMAEPIQAALRQLGLRLRVYAPVGELVPGMAYLVRRLLENTSNESFVRARFADHKDVEELVAPPRVDHVPAPDPPARRPPTDPHDPQPYAPEPLAEWRRPGVLDAFSVAVRAADHEKVPRSVPGVVNGHDIRTTAELVSVDPGQPDRVIAISACCTTAEADAAVAAVGRAQPAWMRKTAVERAAVLFGAAEWLRVRRHELAALEVFEAGKPWREADADVCEAIDFCEYYGREAIRLDGGGAVQSPPGESNALRYQAKGIGVVIAPWNFPLAIPAGMVAAALVTGNGVVFKPAEQTPAVAGRLVAAFLAAGLPSGVLAFLPGVGEEVGAHLVAHRDVDFITFTGSRAVGLGIVEAAAKPRDGQDHVKRVVAEMGGKNAIVVDADADLDQAVPAIVYSAFGYAGQKCSAASRVILVDAVFEEALQRIVGAADELVVGHPRRRAVHVGPLIDADAHRRVNRYVDMAAREGRVVLGGGDVPASGWFVPPTVVSDVALHSPLAREEIFGPVLTILRATDFSDAIAIANATPYALTAGVFSRSPVHVEQAAHELRAGNVYVNRGITGAVVGRQPFGGYGMSGVGSKAGGPDYLLQFVDPKTITENTLRQGFAPQ
jgi:RHH-type transcriptional regulator, proline utilization regulon repressor / proline dehydrogenase / delta 1-pyrroline-5-carboxylate dehydrogenase